MRAIVDGWRRVTRRRLKLKDWLITRWISKDQSNDSHGHHGLITQLNDFEDTFEEALEKGEEEGGLYGRAKAFNNYRVKNKVFLVLIINAVRPIDLKQIDHHCGPESG